MTQWKLTASYNNQYVRVGNPKLKNWLDGEKKPTIFGQTFYMTYIDGRSSEWMWNLTTKIIFILSVNFRKVLFSQEPY